MMSRAPKRHKLVASFFILSYFTNLFSIVIKKTCNLELMSAKGVKKALAEANGMYVVQR